jgi:hypothetical protein
MRWAAAGSSGASRPLTEPETSKATAATATEILLVIGLFSTRKWSVRTLGHEMSMCLSASKLCPTAGNARHHRTGNVAIGILSIIWIVLMSGIVVPLVMPVVL